MLWNPTNLLIAGELDMTVAGRVTGKLYFLGLEYPVELDLKGDCHRDVRGAKLAIPAQPRPFINNQVLRHARSELWYLAALQVGEVGEITAGLPPRDYVDFAFIEWYSWANGHVVLELPSEHVLVVGEPLPSNEQQPKTPCDHARLSLTYDWHLPPEETSSS